MRRPWKKDSGMGTGWDRGRWQGRVNEALFLDISQGLCYVHAAQVRRAGAAATALIFQSGYPVTAAVG